VAAAAGRAGGRGAGGWPDRRAAGDGPGAGGALRRPAGRRRPRRPAAAAVVRTVVEQIERRVAERTRSAVTGALNRASRTRRPRPSDIDLGATIGRNL